MGNIYQDRIKKVVSELWNNRVDFVKYIILGEGSKIVPTSQQIDTLRAVDNNKFVAVKSGHGIGKTSALAWIIWHYLMCRPHPRVICTAPSKHQLYDVLWSELFKWHRFMMRHPIGTLFANQFELQNETVFHKDYKKDWFAVARTAKRDNPDALQGFHADYVMRILEEASGIPDNIFEVLEGAHGMKESVEIRVGNPTKLTGEFYRSFNKEGRFFKKLTHSCINSPIVPKRYIDRMRNKYGETSNMYRVRVLGEFPSSESDSFIPFDFAYSALNRDIDSQAGKKKVLGCDIGRGGDETVLMPRQGDEFYKWHTLRNRDTMQTVSYIAHLANQEKFDNIFIDVIGIGAGVYDRLREMGFPVIAVNVAEAPSMNLFQYNRLRDELWGMARDWLEARRGKIWDNSEDQDFIAQWTTPKYKILSNGKIQIESKDDMKKRGVSSPNIADAANLTFALPTADYNKYVDNFDDNDYNSGKDVLDKEVGY
jgi:phage terminase large subunit